MRRGEVWWVEFDPSVRIEVRHQGLELIHILAALLNLFHVSFELTGIVGLAHQIPNCSKRSSAFLA